MNNEKIEKLGSEEIGKEGGTKSEQSEKTCTISYNGGSEYTGECINSVRSGWGVMKYAYGDVYEGEWKDNKCHGKGRYTYSNGRVFEGEWANGKRHGKGKYIFAGDYSYSNEWVDGVIKDAVIWKRSNADDGYAHIEHRYSNGNLFEGYSKNVNKPDGYGVYTFSKGNVYVGYFKDGKYDGYGTYTGTNGNVYVGEYKEGKWDGYGVYTWKDGTKYEGEWKDDERHGRGKQTYSDGRVYEGEWQHGLKHGNGTLVFASGDKYVGEYKEGKRDGYGVYTWKNGTKYAGEWKCDKRHGKGKQTYSDGRVDEGKWRDDKLEKKETQEISNESRNNSGLQSKGQKTELNNGSAIVKLVDGIDVFISHSSSDFTMAKVVFDELISSGKKAFLSELSLPKMGNADFAASINDALDKAEGMIVIVGSKESLNSNWVEYEWKSFFNEKCSGRKAGNLITVVADNSMIRDLPYALRQYEVIPIQAVSKILAYF